MKKIYILTAIAALCALAASCQKEEESPVKGEKVQVSINVTMDEPDTKVTYTTDGTDNTKLNFAWNVGDEVSIVPRYIDTEVSGGATRQNCKFTVQSVSGKTATLTGSITAWDGVRNVYAIYPYKESISYNNGAPLLYYGNPSTSPALTIAADETECSSVPMQAIALNLTFANLSSTEFTFATAPAIRIFVDNVPAGQTVTKAYLYSDKATGLSLKTICGSAWQRYEGGSYAGFSITGTSAGADTYINFPIAPISYVGSTLYIEVITKGADYTEYSYCVSKNGINMASSTNKFYPLTIDCSTAAPLYTDNTSGAILRELGVKIQTGTSQYTYWAQHNAGYAKTTSYSYLYGKLYQWGAENGGGYNDGSAFTDETALDVVTTAVPTPPASKFYTQWAKNTVWSSTAKTATDPCPRGWRVPSSDEMYALMTNWNGATFENIDDMDPIYGHYFSGKKDYASASASEKIFLPAAGRLYYANGECEHRNEYGNYWTSSLNGSSYPGMVDFTETTKPAGLAYNQYSAWGCAVRCVAIR